MSGMLHLSSVLFHTLPLHVSLPQHKVLKHNNAAFKADTQHTHIHACTHTRIHTHTHTHTHTHAHTHVHVRTHAHTIRIVHYLPNTVCLLSRCRHDRKVIKL